MKFFNPKIEIDKEIDYNSSIDIGYMIQKIIRIYYK